MGRSTRCRWWWPRVKLAGSPLGERQSLRRIGSATCLAFIVWLACTASAFAQEDAAIDASDPTKIYTFVGGGLKVNDYTNGESMLEMRATGNIGFSDVDSVLLEAGYGWHDGNRVRGSNDGLTNARARWFHLFEMDYDKVKGYRGMATQVDLQLAGRLKGTDGQNVLAAGVMPAYALGDEWNLYLMLNGVAAWDKGFSNFNGFGVGIAPKLVFSTERWWPGAQIQITPNVKHFVSGHLEGDGDITLELNIGGEITPTIMWDIVGEKNYNLDLTSLRRGVETGLKGDWNVFFNVTTYF
jgi:hypothetical protein